jgi:hypothetical protein
MNLCSFTKYVYMFWQNIMQGVWKENEIMCVHIGKVLDEIMCEHNFRYNIINVYSLYSILNNLYIEKKYIIKQMYLTEHVTPPPPP